MKNSKIALIGLNFMSGLSRSTMIFRGILFILLGLALAICPLGIIRIMVQVVGVFLVFNGIAALFMQPDTPGGNIAIRWGLPILTILLGLFAFLMPGETQWTFLMFIAAWLLLSGGAQLARLFLPGNDGTAKVLIGLSAVIYILLGILFVTHPFTGLAVFVWLFAVSLIAGGVFTIVLGCCMPQLIPVSAGFHGRPQDD